MDLICKPMVNEENCGLRTGVQSSVFQKREEAHQEDQKQGQKGRSNNRELSVPRMNKILSY